MITLFLVLSVNTVIYLSEINMSTLDNFQEGEVILMSREEILEVAEQLCHLLKYEFIFVPVSISLDISFPCCECCFKRPPIFFFF